MTEPSEMNQSIINEWYKNICSVNRTQKRNYKATSIGELLNNKENKVFFVNLVCQKEVDDIITDEEDENNKKILSSEGYRELCMVIKYALSFLNKDEYNLCKSLTTALFGYCTIDKKTKKEEILYQEYVHYFQPCKRWTEYEFWKFWFLDEVEKEHCKKLNFSKSFDYEEDPDFELNALNKMAIIMKNLSLVRDFILIITVRKLGKST